MPAKQRGQNSKTLQQTQTNVCLFSLYLDLKGMNHDLHQHLLVGQEAVQVKTLALYRLPNKKVSFKTQALKKNCKKCF